MGKQGKDVSARRINILPPDFPGSRFAQQGLPGPAFKSEIETGEEFFYKSPKKLYDAAAMCYATSN